LAFNSLEFGILFLAVFVLYYLPFLQRYQVGILIASSLLFYAIATGWQSLLLISSIGFNAFIACLILSAVHTKRQSICLALGIVFNLSLLSVFKYGALISNSVSFVAFGENPVWLAQLAVLPIGLSFYCFEGISLLVDSRKGLLNLTTDFKTLLLKTSLFISFFPHLISGPILRAAQFFPQISANKKIGNINWYFAFNTLVLGYFLKVVVADNLAGSTWLLRYPYFNSLEFTTSIVLLCAYSAQIFADFAGYSLIAIGLAALLGYSLPENFKAPYISTSLSEFWKRWHITLSSWLRDYLFIPLGGSRGTLPRACFNVFLVMALGGLWHGASWNFAFWGIVHGLGLVVEHLVSAMSRKCGFNKTLPTFARILLVFSFVTLAWLAFILKDPGQIVQFCQVSINGWGHQPNRMLILFCILYSMPVVALHLWAFWKERRPELWVYKSATARIAMLCLMLFLLIVNPGPQHEFIYFQF
jgi:alginate O-acetyltransferase complex protein AlgI